MIFLGLPEVRHVCCTERDSDLRIGISNLRGSFPTRVVIVVIVVIVVFVVIVVIVVIIVIASPLVGLQRARLNPPQSAKHR